MLWIAVKPSIMRIVLVAALLPLLLVGCAGEEDEIVPLPPPGAAGTYYGIANFGAGEGMNTEHRVKLVIEESANAIRSGQPLLSSVQATRGALSGFISYGDSTYGIEGAADDDSLSVSWTTASGTWMLFGGYDAEGIHGIASGPSGTDTLGLYRWKGNMSSIAGPWEGAFPVGPCWPQSVSMRASFVQSDTLISGYLIVTGDPGMGDTLRIYEGSFFDPILEVIAIDSNIDFPHVPPKLCLLGVLESSDSMAGTYDWWWDRCFGEGTWYLKTDEPDTGNVFAGILAMAYRREGATVTVSMASVYWAIGDS
ncbi:MAG: hypothetical protein FJY66_04385, partial [Calditrichaeota bacterium]|nr:hypothetical protein [Calditrichota bacterium]